MPLAWGKVPRRRIITHTILIAVQPFSCLPCFCFITAAVLQTVCCSLRLWNKSWLYITHYLIILQSSKRDHIQKWTEYLLRFQLRRRKSHSRQTRYGQNISVFVKETIIKTKHDLFSLKQSIFCSNMILIILTAQILNFRWFILNVFS